MAKIFNGPCVEPITVGYIEPEQETDIGQFETFNFLFRYRSGRNALLVLKFQLLRMVTFCSDKFFIISFTPGRGRLYDFYLCGYGYV